MNILALDHGKFNSVCCFFNDKTRRAKFLTTPTTPEHLSRIFRESKPGLVIMEACGPSGWINDLAKSCGFETLVCSTNEEAWRWANVKRKTDKDDAIKLAGVRDGRTQASSHAITRASRIPIAGQVSQDPR